MEQKRVQIEYIPIGEIKPYEKNPRINEGGVAKVAESIKQYGFKVPIVLDSQKVIICGHTRYKAALQLGLDSVPCIMAKDLTKKQVKAFRIADNKTADFSIWDNKLLLEELEEIGDDFFTGFDDGGLFDDTLKEDDNTPLDENDFGVVYRAVFESEDRDKIEKITELWEGLNGEDTSG